MKKVCYYGHANDNLKAVESVLSIEILLRLLLYFASKNKCKLFISNKFKSVL